MTDRLIDEEAWEIVKKDIPKRLILIARGILCLYEKAKQRSKDSDVKKETYQGIVPAYQGIPTQNPLYRGDDESLAEDGIIPTKTS